MKKKNYTDWDVVAKKKGFSSRREMFISLLSRYYSVSQLLKKEFPGVLPATVKKQIRLAISKASAYTMRRPESMRAYVGKKGFKSVKSFMADRLKTKTLEDVARELKISTEHALSFVKKRTPIINREGGGNFIWHKDPEEESISQKVFIEKERVFNAFGEKMDQELVAFLDHLEEKHLHLKGFNINEESDCSHRDTRHRKDACRHETCGGAETDIPTAQRWDIDRHSKGLPLSDQSGCVL